MADPSTVTVRIESASTSDLNVQDVSTTSSSNDDDNDDDDIKQHRRKQTLNDSLNYRTSSAASHQTRSTIEIHHKKKNSLNQKRPSHLNTDVNSMRVPQSRPTTAISLPAKPSTYDNEWDFDSDQTLVSPVQRRNPSCPSISPTTIRSKSSSSQSPILPTFTPQQAPPVFTTTSECLGNLKNK